MYKNMHKDTLKNVLLAIFYNFGSAAQSVFRKSRHKISAGGQSENLRRGKRRPFKGKCFGFLKKMCIVKTALHEVGKTQIIMQNPCKIC